MSHSASQSFKSNPSQTDHRTISRVSSVSGIDPVYPSEPRGSYRRSTPISDNVRVDIEFYKFAICTNFDKIISDSESKDSIIKFKFYLRKLNPENLEFLADYYFQKLASSENNCDSSKYNFEKILSAFSNPRDKLYTTFIKRIQSNFEHNFVRFANISIRNKFLEMQRQGKHNNFFKIQIDANASITSLSQVPQVRSLFLDSSAETSNSFTASSSLLSSHQSELDSFSKKLHEIDRFIAHNLFYDPDNTSKKYNQYANELLNLILDHTREENVDSLGHRGAINKYLFKKISSELEGSGINLSALDQEIKEELELKSQLDTTKSPKVTSDSPQVQKYITFYKALSQKPGYLHYSQSKYRDKDATKHSLGRTSPSLKKDQVSDASKSLLVRKSFKLKADKEVRLIDNAIELFNKIAKNVNLKKLDVSSKSLLPYHEGTDQASSAILHGTDMLSLASFGTPDGSPKPNSRIDILENSTLSPVITSSR